MPEKTKLEDYANMNNPGLAFIDLNEEFKNVIREALQLSLTPKEIAVICNRFGIDNYDGKSHTLEEVGQMFGVTRERIRQIEAKSLRRLKKRSSRNGLEDYKYAKLLSARWSQLLNREDIFDYRKYREGNE